MKKILSILIVLLALCSTAIAQPRSANYYVGLNFSDIQAKALVALGNGADGVLSNNVYLKARNAAKTANLSLLKADSSNNTKLNAPTAGGVSLSINDSNQVTVDTNGLNLIPTASRIIPGATSLSLRNNANNADNLICTDAGVCTVRAGATITAGNLTVTNGNINVSAAKDINMSVGLATLALQESTAGTACSGSVTANATTPVVTNTTCATTGSRIFLTKTSTSTVNGSCYISAISNGVSFSITCLATDTGTYNFIIFHEAP